MLSAGETRRTRYWARVTKFASDASALIGLASALRTVEGLPVLPSNDISSTQCSPACRLDTAGPRSHAGPIPLKG